jgi:cytochrome c-type biogenesis protein CcmH
MTLWLVLAALAVVALAVVVSPLLRDRTAPWARADYDIEVYLDQLRELDRDAARDLIGATDAAAARTEIERRLLAADRARSAGSAASPVRDRTRFVPAVLLAIAVPAASLALYLQLGSPGLPGEPFAGRSTPPPPASDVAARTASRLADAEAAVRGDPTDAAAWYDLGRLRLFARQAEQAVAAFAEAVRLAPDDAEFASAWGEAQTIATAGQVTAPALAAFERALVLDPSQARARFFVALAALQAGRDDEALQRFAALLRDAPDDAPWRAQVETRARTLAERLGADFDALVAASDPTEPVSPGSASTAAPAPESPAASRGPTADDLAAARDMSEEDRSAMVRGMVEGLAARLEDKPDDVEGWRRLARSWGVLGEHAKASAAYGRALELEPEHPETLFRAAVAASDAGDRNAALARFLRLRELIPRDTDAYGAVNRAIERLQSTGPDR